MSDSFQSYVFLVQPETRAAYAADDVSDWLIEAGVITRDMFDNVLKHGSRKCAAVSRKRHAQAKDDSRSRESESLRPAVGMEAVGAWVERKDARAVCRKCNKANDIFEWDFGEKLAMGNLIVCFWNWPKLRKTLRLGLEQAAGVGSKMVVGRI